MVHADTDSGSLPRLGSARCSKQGLFFSKAAVVTFGGAYTVLPYIRARGAVSLRLDQTGPDDGRTWSGRNDAGPANHGAAIRRLHGRMASSPRLAAASRCYGWRADHHLGRVTPCFLWIFLGGPHIEQLRGNARLTSALTAITAAIVGVVLNLAVWFALHVFFRRRHRRLVCILLCAAVCRHAALQDRYHPYRNRRCDSRSTLQVSARL